MIDSETGYLFTNDDNILRKEEKEKKEKVFKKLIIFIFHVIFYLFSKFVNKFIKKPLQKSEYGYYDDMRYKITVYYKKVYNNLKDLIPKMIGFYLVKTSQEKMHSILATETLKNEKLLESFKEVLINRNFYKNICKSQMKSSIKEKK